MRAYVLTTGALFGLIFVAHIWRVIVEGAALAKDPIYIVLTITAAALCLWALRLLRLMQRSWTSPLLPVTGMTRRLRRHSVSFVLRGARRQLGS